MSTEETAQQGNQLSGGDEPQQLSAADGPANFSLPPVPQHLMPGQIGGASATGDGQLPTSLGNGAPGNTNVPFPPDAHPTTRPQVPQPTDPRRVKPAKSNLRMSGTTLLHKITQYQSDPGMMAKLTPLIQKFALETDWAVVDDYLRKEGEEKRRQAEARAAEQKTQENVHSFQLGGVMNRPVLGQTRNIGAVGEIFDPAAKRRRMDGLQLQETQAQMTKQWLEQQTVALQLQQQQMQAQAERLRRERERFAQEYAANQQLLQTQANQLRQQQTVVAGGTQPNTSEAQGGSQPAGVVSSSHPVFVANLQSSLPTGRAAGASSLTQALPAQLDVGQAQLVDQYLTNRNFQQSMFGTSGASEPTVVMLGSTGTGKTGIIEKLQSRQPFKIREVILEVAPKSRQSIGVNLKKSLSPSGDPSSLGEATLSFLLRRALDHVLVVRNEVLVAEFEKAASSAETKALMLEGRDLLVFGQEVAFLCERYTPTSVMAYVDAVFEKMWRVGPRESTSFADIPSNVGMHCLVPMVVSQSAERSSSSSAVAARRPRGRHYGACYRFNDGECHDVALGGKCKHGYRHVCSKCGKSGHRRSACAASAKSGAKE